MMYKLLLSLFVVACVGVGQINGQYCIPLGVENITLSYDAELTWQKNSEEKCTISYFLVYIDSSTGNEYVYAVSSPRLAVRFLPVCDDYIFRIAAISSENIESPEIRLATKIPLPANANLTVAFIKVTAVDEQSVLLEWNLEQAWQRCADRFRVIIDDQDLDFLQDVYTYNTSILIPNLAACTSYEFGVIAIYNWAIEGPVAVVQFDSPPLPIYNPSLYSLSLGNTYVNITWQLEPYVWNKCAVTELVVVVRDTVSNFNLTIPVVDQVDRAPVLVRLTNLKNDNLYFVNTTVYNIAGPSTPVILVVQTRP